MWSFILRRIVYSIPVYLLIVFLVMLMLRVNNPVDMRLGKMATAEDKVRMTEELGLDRPFIVQYGTLLKEVVSLNFERESWDYKGKSVGEKLAHSIIPSLVLTVPALCLTSLLSICIGIVSSFFRGRWLDRWLMTSAVLGMSVSFAVYIIVLQRFGSQLEWPGTDTKVFAIQGFDLAGAGGYFSSWFHYCMLPVCISVIVAMGYDTRFYRSVMVEECNRDYIVTATAKGATSGKIMFVHMLKNAMIPIVTRIMITLPFLVTGSILLEEYFAIPGMGRTLMSAIRSKDFPIIEAFTSMFALLFIISNILTDVAYALVDPRVRLS